MFLFIDLIRDWAFRTTKSQCGSDFECLGVWVSEWGCCNEADFQGMTSQRFLKVGTWDMLWIAGRSKFLVTVKKSGYSFFFGVFGITDRFVRGQK